MIILDILYYFTQFPSKKAVLNLFNNGSSDYKEYAEILHDLATDDSEPLIPELEGFVFGQSFDKVAAAIDRITGTYLFVDFGEILTNRDSINSVNNRMKIAVTIAHKAPDSSDLVETAIVTDRTLALMERMLRIITQQSEQHLGIWSEALTDFTVSPFTSPEFKSLGWTVTFDLEDFDLFNLKGL